MGATNVKISLDQGLECTFALVAYRLTEELYLKEIWEKKNVKVLQIERWNVMFNVDLWNDKMALLALKASHLFFEILRVVRYDWKTHLTINTKWLL